MQQTKIKTFLFLFSLLLIFSSCSSTKKIETVTITGIVEKNSSYSITENYNSRSKIFNYINKETSDKASYKELKNRVGEVVTAEVSIIEDKGFWEKEVSLINIL